MKHGLRSLFLNAAIVGAMIRLVFDGRSGTSNVNPIARHRQHRGEAFIGIGSMLQERLDIGTEITRDFNFRDAFSPHALGDAIVDVIRTTTAVNVDGNVVTRPHSITDERAHVKWASQRDWSRLECDGQLLSVF
jgi:hypothetical protein